LKLLVYEYVSGGGYQRKDIPPSVLCEGFAMLRSVASDFKASGHEVHILLDCRVSKLSPPLEVNCVKHIFYPQEAENSLIYSSKIYDGIYIIAPETGQTLQSLVKIAEQAGALSLNCESNAIQRVADKTNLYASLKNSGLLTPKTLFFVVGSDLTEVNHAIKSQLCYPVVFKPSDGVSCGGLSLVKEEQQIGKAMAKIKTVSAAEEFVVQEFVGGEAVSVSLLCAGGEALAISLNKQNIHLATPDSASNYKGGAVPFNHPLRHVAFKAAENAVKSFHGLRGYVGVDLVLAPDKPYVVDINARLTTSYVGLSRVAGFNIAEAMVKAVAESKLPTEKKMRGCIIFSKVETPKPTLDAFQKAAQISEVVSPPFILKGTTKACTLIVGEGESSEDAQLRLEEAKKRLLTIISRGK